MDLVRAHPLFAAGSFVATGTVAGGLAHHFLDLETPYAVAAGVATGAAVVGAEGYAYAEYVGFKNWLTGWTGAAGGAAVAVGQAVGEPVGSAVEKVEDAIGLNGDHIDLDDVMKHGTADEKALAKQITQLMFSGKLDKDKEAQIQKLLQQLAALMAHPDAPDGTDASFTSNNQNPAPPTKASASAFKPGGTAKVAMLPQPDGVDIDDSDVEDRWPLYHPSETVLA
jgi:hypothetical protein